MKSLDDMTEPELKALFIRVGDAIKRELPPCTGFVVLATPFGKHGIAQYASNCRRDDAKAWMLETVARWDARDFVPRVGD